MQSISICVIINFINLKNYTHTHTDTLTVTIIMKSKIKVPSHTHSPIHWKINIIKNQKLGYLNIYYLDILIVYFMDLNWDI